MNDVLQKQIDQIKALIEFETKAMSEIPEFLKDSVMPKKTAVIDQLQKNIVKLESEMAKNQKLMDKEAKEKPFKDMMNEINNLKMTLEERRSALAIAQGAYETNRDKSKNAEKLSAFTQASNDFYAIDQSIKIKTVELKKLKEQMKS